MPSKPKFEAQSFSYVDPDSGVRYELDLKSLHQISKSRESYGVWRHGGRAWKIFPKTQNYNRMVAAYQRGHAITPAYQFFVGKVTGNNGLPKEGVALASTYVSGRFFKLKDSTGIFKKAISSISNVATLQRIEAALIEAERINLRDPQGFINSEDEYRPIVFIDIHTHSTPSANLIAMRKWVSDRIKKFQA